jgi:hypothetical protein
MQGFELQDHRKLRRATQFVLDDVTGDFFRQCKWESHGILGLNRFVGRQNCGQSWIGRGGRRVGFQQARQEKGRRRDTVARIDAAASRSQKNESRTRSPCPIFAM